GRRGHVVVNPLTDFPESRFRVGELVYTKVGTDIIKRRITEVRFQRGRPVIGFDDIHSITDAEELRDCELRIPESALRPLPAGTYYSHDLVGCEVVTRAGTSVGVVSEIEGPTALQRLIVVKKEKICDVPLVDAVCVSIDVRARRICIDPPVGLLDLNDR
ncbi:MAG TPA: 16S rRNA processing protein RimM, partial [Acidobacteria bacterium]|nr:16S rRNA processing protein RimM [Acidobacteriota bacterium]